MTRDTDTDADADCLAPDAIFAFLAGDLDEAASEAVEIHIDECTDCRGLLAEAARRDRQRPAPPRSVETEDTQLDTGSPRSVDSDYPSAGTVIDRYTVDRFLGAGGMGVVLLASDPELDRKVTIKLLRPELADPDDTRGARARLLREAQAMAKLSHPNVVPIYDIGTWNDQVFIAMEYLDGGTLATRLEGDQPTDEVIELFLAAGRGLAAAHAAKLIHRDFKPANVMLSKTGAVKVTDFGLALPGSASAAALGRHRRSAEIAIASTVGPDSLTKTGMIVGTPAYMAPEQMQGNSVDVRSDIFSFCVALHEGLFGSRPFHGDSTDELLSATLEQRIEPPRRDPKLPDRVRAIIARGLEAEPGKRPRQMDEVLAALAPRRTTRWPMIAAIAASLATTALIAAGIGWARASDEALELVATTCSNGPERFAPSWNGDIASSVTAALGESKIRAPDVVARKVRRQLDRYRDQWIGVHRSSCTATRLAGEQSVELMEAQMACLERRRGEVDRAVSALKLITSKNASAVESMVASLTSPAVCMTAASMAREPPMPADSTTSARVTEVRASISGALGQSSAGQLDEALRQIKAATELAREVGFAPAEAEAWLAKGRIELIGSRFDAALASFRETIQLAQLGNHDQARADAYVGIIDLQIERGQVDEAERYLRYARDALAQVAENLDAGAALASRSALINRARGKINEAIADGERALALRRKLHGDRSPEIAQALRELASLHANAANQHPQAIPLYREAVAMLTDLYGDSDERLVDGFTGLAASLSLAGDHDEALEVFDRRGALLEKVLGANNPMLVSFRAGRAQYLARAGRHDEAMAELDAAVAGSAKVFGEGSREHTDNLVTRGGQLYLAKRYDKAHDDLDKGVAMAEKLYGPGGEATLIYRNLLGTNLTAAGRLREAQAALGENIANATKTLAPDAPLLADALTRMAKAERLAGRGARAVKRLERVLGMVGRQPAPRTEAFARWQLGQALGNGKRAVEMVTTARRFYASPRGDPESVAEIDAWLKSR